MKTNEYDSVNKTENGDVFMVHTKKGTKKIPNEDLLKSLGMPFRLTVDKNGQYGYIRNDTGEFVRFVNPSGTLIASEKGEYDVANYEYLNMNIPFDLGILVDLAIDTADLCTCRDDDTDQTSDIWSGNTPEDGWCQGIILPEGYRTLVVRMDPSDSSWSDWYNNYDDFDIKLYTNPTLTAQSNESWTYEYEIYDQYKVNSNNELSPVISNIVNSPDNSGWSVVKVYNNVPPYSVFVPRFIKNNSISFPKRYFGLMPVNASYGIRYSYDYVWEEKTFTGLTAFIPKYIWTDGDNTYYSQGSRQYVFNKRTGEWVTKTWNGCTNFSGDNVWTDGENIRLSQGTDSQYILDKETSTWVKQNWNGDDAYGYNIWTDGENIYNSCYSIHFVLDKDTGWWIRKKWNNDYNFYFEGAHIWTDGENTYYSWHGYNSYEEYEDRDMILDKTTGEWITKTWNGLSKIDPRKIWHYGENTYYSDKALQYVLDKTTSTWVRQNWGKYSRLNGEYIWTDGENMYHSEYHYDYSLPSPWLATYGHYMLLKH